MDVDQSNLFKSSQAMTLKSPPERPRERPRESAPRAPRLRWAAFTRISAAAREALPRLRGGAGWAAGRARLLGARLAPARAWGEAGLRRARAARLPPAARRALGALERRLLTSDWALLGHGDDWVEVSGWRVLAPERYALLVATTLSAGWLYGAWLLWAVGLAGAVWVGRRFWVRVSVEGEFECRTSLCGVPYRALRLPLWAPLYCEGEGALRRIRLGGDGALLEPIELICCGRARADILCALVNSTAQHAQRLRLEAPAAVPAPPRPEEGAWVLSLIEGAPTALSPAASRGAGGGACSWWAPRADLCLSCALWVLCAPALAAQLPASLLLVTCAWLLAAAALLSARETLSVSPQGALWRRALFGFTLSSRAWAPDVRVQLEVDSLAPRGRRVLLYERGRPETLTAVGAPWDAPWIYSTLTALQTALQREAGPEAGPPDAPPPLSRG